MSTMAEARGLAALAAPSFSGRSLRPTDREREDRRSVHDGLTDTRPIAIASCHGVADVVEAVRSARALGLDISVRGGGRRTAGEGLMIDLWPMKGVHVDVPARTVRAQGGVLWREIDRETQLHGLATPGGIVGSQGIAGLTLGGGIGWLMPKYGLALDNLRAADVVLADGSVVRANARENPDLFWAMRGGGGNFGIAVSLEYAVHPIGPLITSGVVAHPLARGVDVLRFFRDICASLPDEAMLVAVLQAAPDRSNARMVGIAGGHCGPVEDGRAVFRPLKTFGPPVLDLMGTMPYVALNSVLEPAFPKAALRYRKAQVLTDLSDDAIRTLLAGFRQCPSPMSHIMIAHVHGVATRLPVGLTACPTRVRGFNVVVVSQWMNPRETERSITWARETCASLAPYGAPRRSVSDSGDDAPDPAEVAYGPKLPRLRAIKAKYDPGNVFRPKVNILPA